MKSTPFKQDSGTDCAGYDWMRDPVQEDVFGPIWPRDSLILAGLLAVELMPGGIRPDAG
jgi:hypothetical protein